MLTPDALIAALGETIAPLVHAERGDRGSVAVHVRPGAALTSGQLAEAINATPGVRITFTYAIDPPVFIVKESR